MDISIVIPCLNEANTLKSCINEAKKGLASLDKAFTNEIIVSDNGSTDGSQDIATKAGAKLVYATERGYGNALIAGITSASGKYIIIGDGDHSYDFTAIAPFIQHLEQGSDLVMGNRFKGCIKTGAMPFLNQYVGNPVLSMTGRILYNNPCGDFHSGLRAFNKKSIESLHLECGGMEFASEMVIKAVVHGLKITEVPITLYPDGRVSAPHLKRWRDGVRHLKLMIMYKLKTLRTK